MRLIGFTRRESFFLYLLLFSVFSGSIRKWFLFPDYVNHGLLAFQILIPWIFCLGFYPWNQSKIYVYLFIYWLILFVLAILPDGCGFYHSFFGFLLHGGFWTALFVFLANSNKVNWGRFYNISLLLLGMETVLGIVQYTFPPNHIINEYANFNAIGDIALLGKSARVTGTFSYVSGLGSFILFMSFQLWYISIGQKYNPILIFLHLICLAILSVLNGSRAILFVSALIILTTALSRIKSGSFNILLVLLSGVLWVVSLLWPAFIDVFLQPLFSFMERVISNIDSGEQTGRFVTPWKNMFFFSGEKVWMGYGLGCTYQGANEIWGTSLAILKYGYYEEESERILMEGGLVLLGLKVILILLFIALSTIPKYLGGLLFILIWGYFPIVSNTYNAFFLLWGIVSIAYKYEQKHRFFFS
jgi:hypothetical protein